MEKEKDRMIRVFEKQESNLQLSMEDAQLKVEEVNDVFDKKSEDHREYAQRILSEPIKDARKAISLLEDLRGEVLAILREAMEEHNRLEREQLQQQYAQQQYEQQQQHQQQTVPFHYDPYTNQLSLPISSYDQQQQQQSYEQQQQQSYEQQQQQSYEQQQQLSSNNSNSARDAYFEMNGMDNSQGSHYTPSYTSPSSAPFMFETSSNPTGDYMVTGSSGNNEVLMSDSSSIDTNNNNNLLSSSSSSNTTDAGNMSNNTGGSVNVSGMMMDGHDDPFLSFNSQTSSSQQLSQPQVIRSTSNGLPPNQAPSTSSNPHTPPTNSGQQSQGQQPSLPSLSYHESHEPRPNSSSSSTTTTTTTSSSMMPDPFEGISGGTNDGKNTIPMNMIGTNHNTMNGSNYG
jgi:hypothetical protein